jgi:SAM-dependent methyltransferase
MRPARLTRPNNGSSNSDCASSDISDPFEWLPRFERPAVRELCGFRNEMTSETSKSQIAISEAELRSLLLQYRSENWRGIQDAETQSRIVEDMLRGDAAALLDQIAAFLPIPADSRILDIGSGVGGFVVACRRRGLRAFGVEPDRIGQGAKITSLQIARKRVTESIFASGIGEELPFPDGCFDVVVMNQVVEHVSNQAQVVREAARILRPGGLMYVACPNYLRFYEPHYKIFWLPLFPKALAGFYLRWRRRSPAMLNQLTYTTNARLKKLLKALGPNYQVLDLHREQFLRKRAEGSFAAKATRIVARLTRVPVFGRLVLATVLKYFAIREGGCEMLVLFKPKVHPA